MLEKFKFEKVKLSFIATMLIYLFLILIFHFLNEVVYMEIMQPVSLTRYEFSFYGHFINFIFYVLMVLFLYFLTNRFMLANNILTIFYIIFTMVSFIKSIFTYEPFYLSDISFVGNGAGDIVQLISIQNILNYLNTYKHFIFFNLLFQIFINLFLNFFLNFKQEKKTRLYGCIITITILILGFCPPIFGTIVDYKDSSFMTNANYQKQGLFVGLYGTYLLRDIEPSNNYNEEEIVNILNEYESKQEVTSWGKPNVIVILSEAFWDLNKLNNISTNVDIYKDYNYVKENSYSFNMISPSYAGRTGNVEFEYCTLSSLRTYAKSIVAYNTFYENDEMSNYPSIANILSQNGYKTMVISPYDEGRIYKLHKIYPLMGFQDIHYLSDLKNSTNESIIKGDNVSEEFLFDYLIEQLEKSDKPTFSFVKTVQNHMPYYEGRYEQYMLDVNVFDDNNYYSSSALLSLQSYAQGIYDASKEIKNLYDYIQNIDTPTVVVYFGDHLPCLTDYENNVDMILQSEFLNTNNELLNELNRFTTECLVFSNFDAKIDIDANYLSFDTLSALILKHLDIEQNSYIDFIYDSIDVFPAGNQFISIDKDGNIYNTKDVPNNMKEYINKKSDIQFYYLNKYYAN